MNQNKWNIITIEEANRLPFFIGGEWKAFINIRWGRVEDIERGLFILAFLSYLLLPGIRADILDIC